MMALTFIVALLGGCGGKEQDTGVANVDADGDGVLNSTDCDDADAAVHGPSIWYEDADGDGYGNSAVFIEACETPDGYVANNTDLDDSNSYLWDRYHIWYADEDGDSFGNDEVSFESTEQPDGYVADNTDCNDSDASVFSGAAEICDGLDNDCDGLVDDADPDRTGGSTWYADADGDAFGNPAVSIVSCLSTPSTVSNSSDCDDAEPLINPGMTEICNDGMDNDCDGTANDCEYEDEISLADANAIFRGEAETDYAGQAIANAGDVDGDGFDDVAIGAPGNGEVGAVFVMSGLSAGEIVLSETTALAKLTGEEVDDNAGASVANIGDVNGDGYDDLLIGADFSSARAEYAGAAYLAMGPVSGVRNLSTSAAVLYGVESEGFLGNPVENVFDMSGDGVSDIAIGAMGEEEGAGAVYLFTGSLAGEIDINEYQARFVGEAPFDSAGGIALASVGDVDGDGWNDLLIGTGFNNSRTGAAYLVLGPSSGDVNLSEVDTKLTGEASGDYAGAAATEAGDVNSDGYSDFFVGAYGNDAGGNNAGAAYLVLGPSSSSVGLSTAAVKFVGGEGDLAGSSVAVIGDTNGDGEIDYLVGAEGSDLSDEDVGAAYLVYGPASGVVDLGETGIPFVGENAEDAAGSLVAAGGDVNADGYQDFLVAAAGADFMGATYLVLGQGI